MYTLNCRGRLLVIDRPVVMGIINATPDSFYQKSRTANIDTAIEKAAQMIREGATILDIGAQSTRPGSEQIGAAAEWDRLSPVVAAIHQAFPDTYISVDTYHHEVAEKAVAAGVSMINDISGGLFDPSMLSTVAALRVPYVCMHVRGNAQTMHQETAYHSITLSVLDELAQRMAICEKAGITDLIMDPGFGFSKNAAQNFQLLKDFALFKTLQKPLLLGISRKSTIYKTLGITPEEALNGTTVLHTAGLLAGANILRVHDVKEAIEAIQLTQHLI